MKNIGYRRLKPNNRSLPPLCPSVGGLAPENNSFRVIGSVYRKSWADVARAPVAGRSVNEASDASAVFTPAALGMNSAAVVLQLLAVVSRMTWFSIFSVSLFGLPVEHSAPLLLTWRRVEEIWNF